MLNLCVIIAKVKSKKLLYIAYSHIITHASNLIDRNVIHIHYTIIAFYKYLRIPLESWSVKNEHIQTICVNFRLASLDLIWHVNL